MLCRRRRHALGLFTLLFTAAALGATGAMQGEPLPPEALGPGVIESWQAGVDRDRLAAPPADHRARKPGQAGEWVVPSMHVRSHPSSGQRSVVNKWGDPRMGIAFPSTVNVDGAYFASATDGTAGMTALRVVGFRGGQRVAETPWQAPLGDEPRWVTIALHAVDRIEVVAVPVAEGGGYFSMDDLTYTASDSAGGQSIVVDFEDVAPGQTLSGSTYAGLTWEFGRPLDVEDDSVHGPLAPAVDRQFAQQGVESSVSGTRAYLPQLVTTFQSVIRGDEGSSTYPPDSCGAVGPDHYVTAVNRVLAIYNRVTGAKLSGVTLGSFLPGSNGDPRILFDHFSGRWIVLVTDFNAGARIYLAVSQTSNPQGNWFKVNFPTNLGIDAGRWPDYPTLGVDANGIYTSAYMVGGTEAMSIFAIDKAPLIAPSPSLGTVTAFRGLPFEGAIQPVHTYGNPSGQYFISVGGGWSSPSNTQLRIRRVDPPLTAPTLVDLGLVTVPAFSNPPLAAALGSSPGLHTVDKRLMMAVYRDGSIWTCHTISAGGRAAARWYQVDPFVPTLIQVGTVGDPVRHYFFPSLMVNGDGAVVMGFSGSSASEYAGAWYTGRRASDPPGEMAAPVRYKEGESAINNVDSYGRNRWGDYSYTTLDPDTPLRMLTIQEYAAAGGMWGTYVAELAVPVPDCNGNGVPDDVDILNGTSLDCNGNLTPDECEIPPLGNRDCNANGIPDDCDLAVGTSQDCNGNEVPDECDIASGQASDCQPNGIPDSCELPQVTFSLLFNLNTDPGWSREGQWAFGQPLGGGGLTWGFPDPTSGATGQNVFGVNLAGDYATTPATPMLHLTTGPIDLTNARRVKLRYQRWLNTDYPPYAGARVSVSGNDGATWQQVWTVPAQTPVADSSWRLLEHDVSAIVDRKPAVRVRWSYQIGTSVPFPYSGWNIDDIQFIGEQVSVTGDCNGNQLPDECDIANGWAEDCNRNGVPDNCDIASGTSLDLNGNGVPDECDQTIAGDMDCDGDVDFDDIDGFVAALGGQAGYLSQYPDCRWRNADCNHDGVVNFDDIDAFVGLIGR